ncbi:molybdopterin synthase catalytic subunit MoaE [Halomonas denitrificans]|uniref:molybdopterin synthase catalytic subunit MoaE n=1 Tax=Halomonas TaxID=2745 RepID=UPI001A8C1E00|nr:MULTISPECIES: molybdopterin synthase catalytic subunit MoaE [Halomonas]MED5294153.1 molybdopterin synthase catalytic subunit MoaE [Pseudomonadota bacterium]MBN8414265.1 molybdopterin synthase catalytic subunit MoaE [Halomonas litopenaei]MBY5930960.1 molybdopterin synthase catalytic subunit MoaE [Halomonas sp. DP8Y7-3]MBY5984481.1 molybdopterin synthase catalytic subunit MoaE [Halomonas sp. DP5Y7-2]MBY6209113.1 molybdopterin synthase catalytic subunit MoaE [Halomonas sp. DP3Y7-2]
MIRVQQERFDAGDVQQAMLQGRSDVGAVVSFTGLVRDFNERPDVTALTLEHYPGMTEASLAEIEDEARRRWTLEDVSIIHRVGRLAPGDPIVLVVVASAHRRAAYEACEFLMDQLKTRAPFWKKEHTASGDYWVSERCQDHADARRWEGGVQ